MIHYITTNGIGNAWVANELSIVRQAGVPTVLHAMRKPEATFHASDWAQRLDDETRALYPLPPVGLALSVLAAPFLFGSRFFAALGNAIFGKREHTRARVAALAHFFVACHWARIIRREPISLVHSQWIHSCGTIGMYGAWLLNVPFSFTGHAADLFRDRVALDDKIRRAEFIVCISEFHRRFYIERGADPSKLHVVYCGIDTTLFSPPAHERESAGGRFELRASGRLVDKKGFKYLIEACRILLDRGVDLHCTIGGSGPLEAELRTQVEQLKLQDHVTITGKAIKQEEIPAFMHGGDAYCLPCVWAADNDVDGLPQMLMEAMACGLPVISTRLVGIPDLVIDGETGLLVETNDAAQLADAIDRMRTDHALAATLATNGRKHLSRHFEFPACLNPLLALFRSFHQRMFTKAGVPSGAPLRGKTLHS